MGDVAFGTGVFSHLGEDVQGLLVLLLPQEGVHLLLPGAPLVLGLVHLVQLHHSLHTGHKGTHLLFVGHARQTVHCVSIMDQVQCGHTLDLQGLGDLAETVDIHFDEYP